MRIAVLSDIHGNLTAFESVLADLKEVGPLDATWMLGDMVAFGSSPVACIAGVQALPDVQVIQGNTDRYLTADVHPQLARRDSSLQWIVDRIEYADFAYLRDLPTEITGQIGGYGQLTAFHAAPGDDEFGFAPETDDEIIAEKLAGIPGGLVMMGHTHRPMDRQIGEWRVLNVGSVGLPFDGDPRSAFVVLEFDDAGDLTAQVSVKPLRVAYDIEKEVSLLQELEHPRAKLQTARLRSGLLNPPMPDSD